MVSFFTAILCTIFIAGFLAVYISKASRGRKKPAAVSTSLVKETKRTFTTAEVSKHNTGSDCWIIIKNKVYDVTPYVEEHPGGYAILNHAGDDSTEGFYGPQHASRVFDMVDEFYIGELAS